MSGKNKHEENGNRNRKLRDNAEDQLARRSDGSLKLQSENPEGLIHELRVHQIELEMQNEDLRRAQGELDAARARYFDLYNLAPISYFTLSEQRRILEANLTAATLLGVARGALVKRPLTRFILPEDQDIFYRHRKLLFETGAPQVFEMRMSGKNENFKVGRIMIVDDEAELMTALCEALAGQGYETAGFTTGADALKVLRMGHKNLVNAEHETING